MREVVSDRVVITGAPASGKTKFFERLRQEPELAGFEFFDELARRLLTNHPEYRTAWAAFHREIYRLQAAREDDLGGRPFVTDRGTVDAFAFHPESMTDVGTSLEKEYRRYSLVVQLGSTCTLGLPYYKQDRVRTESAEQALAIENAIRRVWSPHPGYHFVAASSDVEEKYNRFRSIIVDNLSGSMSDGRLRK